MAANKAATTATQDRVEVVIPLTRYETDDVTVAVNGKVYQIQRGKPVYVPVEVYEALQMSDYNKTYALLQERKMRDESRFN